MRLKNKVAVVSGGSSGIGKAICERFATHGAKVAVNYAEEADRDYPDAAQDVVDTIVANGGEAVAFEANMGDKSAIDQMVKVVLERWGKIDIMVANAGVCPFEEFLRIDEPLLDKVVSVN